MDREQLIEKVAKGLKESGEKLVGTLDELAKHEDQRMATLAKMKEQLTESANANAELGKAVEGVKLPSVPAEVKSVAKKPGLAEGALSWIAKNKVKSGLAAAGVTGTAAAILAARKYNQKHDKWRNAQ